jgi:hypothetical protein
MPGEKCGLVIMEFTDPDPKLPAAGRHPENAENL